MTLGKKRKLRWFGHVFGSSGLAKTILQGAVTEEEVGKQYQRVDRMAFANSTRTAEIG